MTYVTACIDGSPAAAAVCDHAAWASLRMDAPLRFLHVLDHQRYPAAPDLSGTIGLGSREQLLEELAALDEKRGKLALEQGRLMLSAARERAIADGAAAPETRQRHGSLVDSLRELEPEIRLLVIALHGDRGGGPSQQIGSDLENVIRTMHRPILAAPPRFTAPESVMLAFDGGATTQKGVEMIAGSPLFRGMPVHLVMVGPGSAEASAQLDRARQTLANAGFTVPGGIYPGDVEPTLHAYQAEHGVDLLVMGAYGHSRIRQFLVGSTTTSMLRTTRTPLLLLR